MCIFTKNKIKMKKFIFALCILMPLISISQDNFWSGKTINDILEEDLINSETQVAKYNIYQLDEAQIKSALLDAPLRSESNSSTILLEMPYGDNKFGVFEFFEVQTLSPQLASDYPSIKSYVGKSRGQNSDRLRMTITPMGVYTKIFSNNGSIYINPMTKNGSFYKVFNLADAVFPEVKCYFNEDLETQATTAAMSSSANLVNDSTLRTLRLAVATTAEYAQYHVNEAGLGGASEAQKKAAVLGAITQTVDRVNGILENDLAANLQLIPNNDSIIFLDTATDPFTDASNNPTTADLATENNAYLPTVIGNGNYDIGHVLSTIGGGVAFFNTNLGYSVCDDALKSRASSGLSVPTGDIDLIFAHEIGHQMGARHTQNNDCQRTDSSAYETGSGVTIMSYGFSFTGCSPSVQGFNFDYYHSHSLQQMYSVISDISCAQNTTIANNPPSLISQSNYIIPRRTPFVLDVEASDPDNDMLTYNWEQFDNEISIQPPTSTSNLGPNFRNFQPNASSSRYFPRMETLLNNQIQSTWEVLSNVSRDMNFVVTVRDNNINGGQTVQDLVNVNVVGAAGPFKVTSQNTPDILWNVGDNVTITWNVAGTDANGINANEVDIILSTNGGLSFDEVLLANTLNDGTQNITVPAGIASQNCRLMVKASDNIFFALNEEVFNVNTTCSTESNTNTVSVPDGLGTIFNPTAGVPAESIINIAEDDIVQSVKVNLELTHNRLKDIDIELESPDGEIVQLWSKNLCNSAGMDIRFLDGAQELPDSNCGSLISGEWEPVELLSTFKDGNTDGDWTLRVTDFVSSNTGTIDSWSIEICTAITLNNQEFSTDFFTLYPNPANDVVKILFDEALSSETFIHLYDVNGRLVKTQNISNAMATYNLDVSNLSSGIYFVKVNQNNTETVKKLMVK